MKRQSVSILKAFLVFAGFAIATIVLIGAYAALRKDEPLTPELASLLEQKAQPTLQEIASFKYLLTLRLPASRQTDKRADQIYAQMEQNLKLPYLERKRVTLNREELIEIYEPPTSCLKTVFCAETNFQKERDLISELIEKNSELLRKFDIAIGMGPAYVEPALALQATAPSIELYRLSRVKYRELQLKLYQGRYNEVLKSALAIHDYFSKTLKQKASLLEVTLAFHMLAQNREFLSSAAQHVSEFRKALSKSDPGKLKVDTPFKKVALNAATFELQFSQAVLASSGDLCFFEAASLGGGPDEFCRPNVIRLTLQKLTPYFLKPNRTLNEIYYSHDRAAHEAVSVQNESRIPDTSSDVAGVKLLPIDNIIGENLKKLIAHHYDLQLRKLYQLHQKTSPPLEI